MARIFRVSSLMFAIGTLAFLSAAVAQEKKSDEAERAANAARVLTEIMSIPDQAIPDPLLGSAHGIAVIPHVVKGALGFGGQHGKGLMAQRNEDGHWSAPAYVDITGGSFGLQIGVQATDVVLVFTDEEGVKDLLKSKLKLGADVSAAAGPVGRKAELATDVLLKTAVFAYSRSKGLFAGIALDGSVISIDDDSNEKIYGKKLSAEEILFGKTMATQSDVKEFISYLEKISPPHVHVKK